MSNKLIILVFIVCLIVVTIETVEFIKFKNELKQLSIERTKLSIKLLSLQLSKEQSKCIDDAKAIGSTS